MKKLKKTKFLFSEKNLTVPKKTERGDPLGKKIFRKKSNRSAEKNWKGDPLVSPGMVWYAGKQGKPFWFSSLDQIVQFGAIIFCRTFKNYFGQFVWIERKRKALYEAPTKKRKTTIIVAFHFMKRRLKNKNCKRGDLLSFLKKKENRKIRNLSQSHSAEKLERGDPLGFLKLQFAVKYQKT